MEAVGKCLQKTEYPAFLANNLQFPEKDDAEIIYPESDGEPMGETGYHVRASMDLCSSLRQFFAQRKEVYVAADMFFYYGEGNPKACKAPDIMVIIGCGNQERRTYKLWEEKFVPAVVFEVTSKSSMIDDMVTKPMLYASLGIREYFIFDPLYEYLETPLAGFRLYEREDNRILPDEEGRLFSNELQVFLKRENEYLRVIDPETGKAVPTLAEAIFLASQEAQRAEKEAQRAEKEAQRAEKETQRAEKEIQRAEQETRKAMKERERAERLAAKLREMGMDPAQI
ncbi:MAG: Uma2 family endonuclease [Desulfococcaceae bacterium]|jgi:Uma2 family endonuclease|nr:Uma2 family endonuclease [Desulfococcaceae bacterium]